jgi:hypothetical protein
LAAALEAQEKREEAFGFYRQAAGRNPKVAARSFAALARLEPSKEDVYMRRAVTAEESASGKLDRRVTVMLHELALALRAKGNDRAAEPELRRALIIQDSLAQPDHHVTVAVLNTLGICWREQVNWGKRSNSNAGRFVWQKRSSGRRVRNFP